MAYADAHTRNRNLTAGVAVLAIELGLAGAIITGMTVSVSRIIDRGVTAVALPAPTPPPPPERKSIEPPKVAPVEPRSIDLPLPDTRPLALPDLVEVKPIDPGVRTVEFPNSGPTTKPLFKPRAATPRGDAARWLSTDDYPIKAERLKHEGRTGYRLSLDAGGRVTGCVVTGSSGWAELDQATCQLLSQRARFNPARDETGATTPSSYDGSVQWRLPPEE